MRSTSLACMTATLGLLLGTSSSAFSQDQAADPPDTVTSTAGTLNVEQLAELEFPWAMDRLPDGRLLITEKPGRLRIWQEGELSDPVDGVPEVVYRESRSEQGGLMDVAVDPDFENNRTIYLAYSEAAEQQPEDIADTDDIRLTPMDLEDAIVRGGVVARAKLDGNALSEVEVIWRQYPKTIGRGHFGNRLVFSKDGMLYITSGDRKRFAPAQDLTTNLGKVVRINRDGSVPDDNPFADQEEASGDIWSYGHRNILAAAVDPESDDLYVVEMGPSGGDELNRIEAGKNYGWPLVSNGSHYTRPEVSTALTVIPNHTTDDNFEPPIRSWTPVISPSGATFYTSDRLSGWQGSLLVGGLSSQALVRLAIDGERIAIEERVDMQQRIRDVLEMPDGAIMLLVDAEEGGLLRLTPAEGE